MRKCVRADGNLKNIFLLCLHGQNFNYLIIFFLMSAQMGLASMQTHSSVRADETSVHASGPYVHTDGILLLAQMDKNLFIG